METSRLCLRPLTLADAPFILDLLNQPGFLRFIGDRGVRSAADAEGYLQRGPLASYARFGFGLWLVELKETSEPIGMCGLLKRDELEDVDVGYALLPAFEGRGYATEAAAACVAYARQTLGWQRVVAIVNPDNARSIRVLEKIGLRFERLMQLRAGEAEVALYAG